MINISKNIHTLNHKDVMEDWARREFIKYGLTPAQCKYYGNGCNGLPQYSHRVVTCKYGNGTNIDNGEICNIREMLEKEKLTESEKLLAAKWFKQPNQNE